MTAKIRKLGLTTSEAARHLGVSLSTIRRWSDLGYLNGYRTPGGQRRFSIEQLDDFITSLESSGPQRTPAPAPGESEPRFAADPARRAQPADSEQQADDAPVEDEPRFTVGDPQPADDAPEPPDAA
jgi:excisionase family DNA binding protein